MKTQMQIAAGWRRPLETRAASSAACAALDEARQATTLAGGLAGTLRRLRRDLGRCARCTLNTAAPEAPGCPLPAYWNTLIHQAIREINDEWDSAAGAGCQARREPGL